MELFSKDDSLKNMSNLKKRGQDFKEANAEMTDTIDLKTSDAKNVNYGSAYKYLWKYRVRKRLESW